MNKYWENDEEHKCRFKREELEHELAGEEECTICGRHLDNSGHCPVCEKRKPKVEKKSNNANLPPVL